MAEQIGRESMMRQMQMQAQQPAYNQEIVPDPVKANVRNDLLIAMTIGSSLLASYLRPIDGLDSGSEQLPNGKHLISLIVSR